MWILFYWRQSALQKLKQLSSPNWKTAWNKHLLRKLNVSWVYLTKATKVESLRQTTPYDSIFEVDFEGAENEPDQGYVLKRLKFWNFPQNFKTSSAINTINSDCSTARNLPWPRWGKPEQPSSATGHWEGPSWTRKGIFGSKFINSQVFVDLFPKTKSWSTWP